MVVPSPYDTLDHDPFCNYYDFGTVNLSFTFYAKFCPIVVFAKGLVIFRFPLPLQTLLLNFCLQHIHTK